MDLTKLYFFKVTAETAHMTKAAEQLNTSQPFLSRSIQSLEKELNVQLFDRSGRGIELNEIGRAYYHYVKTLFEALEDGSKVVRELNDAQNNTIKIGTNACSFLPAFFSYAKKKNQNLIIRQETHSLSQLIDLLKEMKIDFVFAVCPNEIGEHEGLSSKLLMLDQMNLIFPIDSPFAKKNIIKFEEIVDFPLITAPEGRGLTDALLYQFSAHETKPNILIETTDIAIIPKYVAHHLGISAFPSSLLPYLSKTYEIAGVSMPNESFVIRLYVLWNSKRFQSSIAQWFLQMTEDFYVKEKNIIV